MARFRNPRTAVIGGLVFILLALGVGIVIHRYIREPQNASSQNQASNPNALTSPIEQLNIVIEIKDGHTLIIRWTNLPQNTSFLDIYRATKGSINWELWKTISITSGSAGSGSAELALAAGENPNSYIFYVSATSDTHEVLWTSTSTPATLPSSPQQGNQPTGQQPSSTSPNTPTSSTQQLPSTQSQTTTPNTPQDQSQNGATYYYNPQLALSGSSTPATANFWVKHVNQAIEIGWQNIPTNSDKAVVLRSQSEQGPWTELLVQKNPVHNAPYSIQVIDDTLNKPFYYKLDLFTGATKFQTYGPLLLNSL